jgi:ubiquinone/menaquinone biosynthesis C-methylase UbiE
MNVTLADSFEQAYKTLIADRHEGWGGEKYSRRLAGWQKQIDKLTRVGLFPTPPASVLEIGCGNGMVSHILARKNYLVKGIDFSTTAISWAISRFNKEGLIGSFLVSDVCKMECCEDGEFDIVIDGNCLHCILADDRAKCLAEVFRVLRPGGYFLLSSMCGPPRSKVARQQYDSKSRCLMKDGYPSRFMPDAGYLIREVVEAGFEVRKKYKSRNAWWDHLWLWTLRPSTDILGRLPTSA